MLQSLNYPEDYDMLSPQAQRAARERAAKEALAGHQIHWVGPEEMPLAAETPLKNQGAGSSSSPPGSAQKPRQPIWCGQVEGPGGLARAASQTNDANKRLQTGGVCK